MKSLGSLVALWRVGLCLVFSFPGLPGELHSDFYLLAHGSHRAHTTGGTLRALQQEIKGLALISKPKADQLGPLKTLVPLTSTPKIYRGIYIVWNNLIVWSVLCKSVTVTRWSCEKNWSIDGRKLKKMFWMISKFNLTSKTVILSFECNFFLKCVIICLWQMWKLSKILLQTNQTYRLNSIPLLCFGKTPTCS